MPTDIERLVVRIEATQKQFEKQLKNANRTAKNSANQMQRDFRRSNKNSAKSFGDLGRAARGGLSNILLAATPAVAAIGLIGIAALNAAKTGERLIIVEKRLEAITGSAARAEASLDAILQVANLTGVGIDTVASSFSRFTLASQEIGATTEETEALTQTILQLGAIGGGTAQELSSGAQQLSQSLAKGVLNGDELRSVMENIPLVARQIADGLNVSIGKLKEMGAAGELTSRKVFDALLRGADDANKRFDNLPPTIERASARMANGWQVFITKINKSIGLSRTLASVINGVADALSLLNRTEDQVLIDTKKRVLASLQKGKKGALQVSTGVLDAEIAIARSSGNDEVVESLKKQREDILKLANQKLSVSGKEKQIIAEIAELEQRVTDKKDEQFDIEKAKGITLGREKAEKVKIAAIQAEINKQEIAALDSKARKIRKEGDAAVAAAKAESIFLTDNQLQEIREAAEKTAKVQITSKSDEKSSKSNVPKISKQAAKDAKELTDFFAELGTENQSLQDQINLLGLSESAIVKLETKQRLLAKAKKEGLDLDRISATTGNTLRQEINLQAEGIANLSEQLNQGKISQERFMTAVDGVADSLAGALVAGESLKDGLRSVFQGIATDILSSGIKKAILGQFPSGGGGGGLLGGILGGVFGGFRAKGGPVSQGRSYIVGENGPELFTPTSAGNITPNNKISSDLLRSPSSTAMQSAQINVTVFVQDDGVLGAIAEQSGASAALPVALQVVEQNNKRVPSIVSEAQGRT